MQNHLSNSLPLILLFSIIISAILLISFDSIKKENDKINELHSTEKDKKKRE